MINCNNCEELNALKQDYKACEEEYKRLAGQYKALLKQNEELPQRTLLLVRDDLQDLIRGRGLC